MTIFHTLIAPSGAYPTPPLSSGARAGNLVFISGTPGIRPGGVLDPDFGSQFDVAVEELKRVLNVAGATLRHLAKVNVLLTRAQDISEMNRRYEIAFGPAPFPARTTLVVVALPHPAMLVEIEGFAVVGPLEN